MSSETQKDVRRLLPDAQNSTLKLDRSAPVEDHLSVHQDAGILFAGVRFTQGETMRTLLLLTFCQGLAACTSNPQQLYQEQVVNASTPLAKTPAEALKNASVQPMQIAPGWRPKQWQITPQVPRLL